MSHQVVHLREPRLDLAISLDAAVLGILRFEDAVDQLRFEMVDVSSCCVLDGVDMLEVDRPLQETLCHRSVFPFDKSEELTAEEVTGVHPDKIKKCRLPFGVAELPQLRDRIVGRRHRSRM